MKEQEYILENVKEFEPKHIFECGQCFRWNKQEDGSYIGVIKDGVLKIIKDKNNIIIKGLCNGNIKDVCEEYFDLNTNYKDIKEYFSKIDENLRKSIEYGNGIRILKQDAWEATISFIISANNNIPRIKGIIERLSQKYGKKYVWDNKEYYSFPTVEELSNATVEELRELGLGFRDERVFETTKLIQMGKVDLNKLEHMSNTEDVREELLKLPGVGPKVANCIMLFSMKKFDVFPIDVWVKKVMTELYGKQIENIKISNKKIHNKENAKILEFANEKFGKLAGIAQQYLFYWRREN
jgi:N-glycosylase/DNA lyase